MRKKPERPVKLAPVFDVPVLNPGDVVKLRSGGPRMTVAMLLEAQNTIKAHCFWFSGNALTEGYFPLGSVVLMKMSQERMSWGVSGIKRSP